MLINHWVQGGIIKGYNIEIKILMSDKLRLCANCNHYHCDNFVPVVESTVLSTPKPLPFKTDNSIFSTSFRESTTIPGDILTFKKPQELNSILHRYTYDTPSKLPLNPIQESPFSTNPSFTVKALSPNFDALPRLTFDTTPFSREIQTERINTLLSQSSSKLIQPYHYIQHNTQVKQELPLYNNSSLSNLLGKSLQQQLSSNPQVRPYQPYSPFLSPSPSTSFPQTLQNAITSDITRNTSPPYQPFPRSKSRQPIKLSPAKVIVTPKPPTNPNEYHPQSQFDTDLQNTNKTSHNNPSHNSNRSHRIDDTIDKNARNSYDPRNTSDSVHSNLKGRKTSDVTHSITKPIRPDSKHHADQIVINGEGISQKEARSIYRDMIGNNPRPSHDKGRNSAVSQGRSQSPRGRIRVQTCTYRDNRCLGIDLTQDRSREYAIDETGHWKDSLHI